MRYSAVILSAYSLENFSYLKVIEVVYKLWGVIRQSVMTKGTSPRITSLQNIYFLFGCFRPSLENAEMIPMEIFFWIYIKSDRIYDYENLKVKKIERLSITTN